MATNKLLKQANALTTSSFSSEKYDLNIIYAIMGQIKEDDLPTAVYEIRPSFIAEHTGRRVRNDDFEKAVNRLLSTIFAITDEKGTLKTTFISSALFLDDGSASVAIDFRLRPYLFELKKNFTIFGLHTAISLNSVYSSRLYTMLCQFRSTGKMWVKVDELRERFCLSNPDGTQKFSMWSAFEKKILKVAQEEINEKADFQIDYELKKKGKKVDEIAFTIKKQKAEREAAPQLPTKPEPPTDPKTARMIERLSEHGFNPKQIAAIRIKVSEESINRALYDISINRENVRNPLAVLSKVFSI